MCRGAEIILFIGFSNIPTSSYAVEKLYLFADTIAINERMVSLLSA